MSNSANILANEIDIKLTLSNLRKADKGIQRMVMKLSNSNV